MGEGTFRQKLRFLRRKRTHPPQDPFVFLNDAPRPPPVPLPGRISDASSADTEEIFPNRVSELRSSSASQDAACLICLDELPKDTPRVRLPCNHTSWHRHCVEEWLRRSARCPLCNTCVPGARLYRPIFSGESRIWERRAHEHELGRARQMVEPVRRFSSQDLAWLLYERRLSSASRPGQRENRRFARSLTTRR